MNQMKTRDGEEEIIGWHSYGKSNIGLWHHVIELFDSKEERMVNLYSVMKSYPTEWIELKSSITL